MVKFGWKKKAETESLLPSKQKSGFFRKKSTRSEDGTIPTNKSIFSRKKYKGEEPPEYETPPPSPLYAGEGQPSPLHVTVVATRPTPPGTPGRIGEDHSLSGTTISDLSGSILTGPIKTATKKNPDSSQSGSENEEQRYRIVSPYSEETPASDPSGLLSQSTSAPAEQGNSLASSCGPDAAADMMKDLLGLVENGCRRPEPSVPDDIKSFETPMVTNKESSFSPPVWGQAPSMSGDEENENVNQPTETPESSKVGMWKYLDKTPNGSACSSPPEQAAYAMAVVDEKQDENTARNTTDTRSSDRPDSHENFELVLAETDEDRSINSDNSKGRSSRWLSKRMNKSEKKPIVDKTPPRRGDTGTSWRRSATQANGEEIPVNEFTIENDVSLTSDMDKEEVYRAVFGTEEQEEEEQVIKEKKVKKTRMPPPKPESVRKKKSSRGMFKAMSKRLSHRPKAVLEPIKPVAEPAKPIVEPTELVVEEKPMNVATETIDDEVETKETEEDGGDEDNQSFVQLTMNGLKEEELLGEELIEEEEEQETSKKRISNFLQKSFKAKTRSKEERKEIKKQKIHEEVEKALSDDSGSLPSSSRSRSWSLTLPGNKGMDPVAVKKRSNSLTRLVGMERSNSLTRPVVIKRSNSVSSFTASAEKQEEEMPEPEYLTSGTSEPKQENETPEPETLTRTSELKQEKEMPGPKSLTRTLSNPFQKMASSLGLKKKAPEKPPEKPPAPPTKPEKPEWKAVVDAGTGKTYFYHRVSRQTTWSKPENYDEQMAEYERAKMEYVESVKPQKAAALSRSVVMSAEQQKKMEDGVPLQPRKRSLTSVLRKKSSRDFNRDVWETKQEITRLLESMGPAEADSAEDLLKRYEGNEKELLLQLRVLAESTPFDEPLGEDKAFSSEEEKKEEAQPVAKVDSRTRTAATASTGASGFSSRMRSGRTALTSLTDTTQKIKNTRNQSAFGPVPESVTQQLDTSMATSLSSDLEDGEQPVTKDPRQEKTVEDRRLPFTEAPTRERSLRVEEFESGRYNKKRAEIFDKKRTEVIEKQLAAERAPTPVSTNPSVAAATQATETPQDLEEASGSYMDDDDADTYGTDSVSELGHSDAEFQRQKRRYDLARRMALDDAIRNRDWELAASVAENIRGRSFDSKTSSVQSYREWTQSELDQFISESDWDAVAGYIAYMRDSKSQEHSISGAGYAIPHMHERKPPRKPSGNGRREEKITRKREPEPRRRESDSRRREPEPRRREPEPRSSPQKRFGARSQLQHDDTSELVSIASSWDSVYRTDSSEDSLYSTSESSYDYRRRMSSRRMAT